MIKIVSKVALVAAFAAGLSTAAIAGGSTTPSAPPPSVSGGAGDATSPANIPATFVVLVTPIDTPGIGQRFRVSVNGRVIGIFRSAAIARFVAAYY